MFPQTNPEMGTGNLSSLNQCCYPGLGQNVRRHWNHCKVNCHHKDFIHYISLPHLNENDHVNDINRYPQISSRYMISWLSVHYHYVIQLFLGVLSDMTQKGLIPIIHPASRKLQGNAPLIYIIYVHIIVFVYIYMYILYAVYKLYITYITVYYIILYNIYTVYKSNSHGVTDSVYLSLKFHQYPLNLNPVADTYTPPAAEWSPQESQLHLLVAHCIRQADTASQSTKLRDSDTFKCIGLPGKDTTVFPG